MPSKQSRRGRRHRHKKPAALIEALGLFGTPRTKKKPRGMRPLGLDLDPEASARLKEVQERRSESR